MRIGAPSRRWPSMRSSAPGRRCVDCRRTVALHRAVRRRDRATSATCAMLHRRGVRAARSPIARRRRARRGHADGRVRERRRLPRRGSASRCASRSRGSGTPRQRAIADVTVVGAARGRAPARSRATRRSTRDDVECVHGRAGRRAAAAAADARRGARRTRARCAHRRRRSADRRRRRAQRRAVEPGDDVTVTSRIGRRRSHGRRSWPPSAAMSATSIRVTQPGTPRSLPRARRARAGVGGDRCDERAAGP